MINHARTLLLNKPQSYFDGAYGNEYIRPNFTPVTLDPILVDIYNILFRNNSDPASMNIVAAGIMLILQSPELYNYTLAFDSRITYEDNLSTIAKLANNNVDIEISKSTVCDIVPKYKLIANELSDDNLAGLHSWVFLPADSTHMLLTYSRGTVQTIPIINTVSPNRSLDISLISEYLSSYFELPSEQVTGDFRIEYKTVIAPSSNIVQQLSEIKTLMAQPNILEYIFNAKGEYKTNIQDLRKVWLHSKEATLQFGAAVLSYLYQCEALRN